MLFKIQPNQIFTNGYHPRTLFTFCVNEDEIGKIYASVGIVGSIAPLLSNPAYRTLYNSVRNTYFVVAIIV